MKTYTKPTIDVVTLRSEEGIACITSGTLPKVKVKGNNGWGNGDQNAPGHSLGHNGAENDQGDKGRGHHKR